MAFASKWMELENIMLSEISWPPKTEDWMFSNMWMQTQNKEGLGGEAQKHVGLDKGDEGKVGGWE